MKVRDLTAKLAKLDPDLDVVCVCEDAVMTDSQLQLFEVIDASVAQAVMGRDNMRKPLLAFGSSDAARPLVIVEITTNF